MDNVYPCMLQQEFEQISALRTVQGRFGDWVCAFKLAEGEGILYLNLETDLSTFISPEDLGGIDWQVC